MTTPFILPAKAQFVAKIARGTVYLTFKLVRRKYAKSTLAVFNKNTDNTKIKLDNWITLPLQKNTWHYCR